MTPDLLIGSRGSNLARIQVGWVKTLLQEAHPGIEVRLTVVSSRGDRDQTSSLWDQQGTGAFTTDLEGALLSGDSDPPADPIDVVVHSCKDLPTEARAGLVIAAVPRREDPRDALVSVRHGDLASLPAGSVIGTSSLRREAQLRRRRDDLVYRSIRGSVETRIRRVEEGTYDAAVLAVAGLKRVGLQSYITEIYEPETLVPAAGQGVLAIQIRSEDERVRRLVEPVNDPVAWVEVSCERHVLSRLAGGCRAPVGVLARVSAENLSCRAIVLSPDGSRCVHEVVEGARTAWEDAGNELVEKLLAGGGAQIIATCRSQAPKTGGEWKRG